MMKCPMMSMLPALVSLLVFSGCSGKKEAPRPKPPVPVTTAAAAVKSVPVQLKAVGNVEPVETVSVKAQISGPVVGVHFREGQDVAKGALLFTIDSRQYQADLKRAEANLNRNLVVSRNAQQDYQRYAQLLKEGIVTQEQVEGYRTKAESTSSDVAADRAAVDNARIQLSYCTIRSTLSGRTGNLAAHVGNVVKANETPLVTLNRISPIYVTFSIPEKELPEIRRRMAEGGLGVEAFPEEGRGAETGKVTFLDNAVDPATGTIKLKATFSNASRRLWPGQFASVVMKTALLPQAVTVPSAALQTGQKGQYVFVVKEDRSAEMRPVVAGVSYGADTVITSSLQPGEVVVTDGQMRIYPGAKVEVAKPGEKKGDPAAPAAAPPVKK
jgi:membrane fusion protein, multidrug efflux system